MYLIEDKGVGTKMMSSNDCFICRKHNGELKVNGGCIYEDEFVYVGHIGSNIKKL